MGRGVWTGTWFPLNGRGEKKTTTDNVYYCGEKKNPGQMFPLLILIFFILLEKSSVRFCVVQSG